MRSCDESNEIRLGECLHFANSPIGVGTVIVENSGHKIALCETDEFSVAPDIGTFTVCCNKCARESGFDRKNFIRKLVRDIPVNAIHITNFYSGFNVTNQRLRVLAPPFLKFRGSPIFVNE
jgi:hypothetical protein